MHLCTDNSVVDTDSGRTATIVAAASNICTVYLIIHSFTKSPSLEPLKNVQDLRHSIV